MARSGRCERRGKVAVDPIPKPDQHASGKTRLRLGDRAIEPLRGATTDAFELAGDRFRDGQDVECVRAERPDRAHPDQVGAVVVLRWRADPAGQADPIARDDGRVPGQGRGDDDRRSRLELHHRRPRAGTRRPHGLDRRDPRSVAARRQPGWRRRGACRATQADGHDPDGDRDDAPPRRGHAREPESRSGEEQCRPHQQQRDRPRARQHERSRSGANRKPRGARHP